MDGDAQEERSTRLRSSPARPELVDSKDEKQPLVQQQEMQKDSFQYYEFSSSGGTVATRLLTRRGVNAHEPVSQPVPPEYKDDPLVLLKTSLVEDSCRVFANLFRRLFKQDSVSTMPNWDEELLQTGLLMNSVSCTFRKALGTHPLPCVLY